MNKNSYFYQEFAKKVSAYGGFYNAHLHIDRVNTLDESYMLVNQKAILDNSFISLHKKHSLISNIHSGLAYESTNMRERVESCLDDMVACNTSRADTMVDVTSDNVGLKGLELLSDIKKAYQDKIDLQLAAYSPFGFDDQHPEAWEIFSEGVKQSDFIGCLPEADDIVDYPSHIGFEAHCERMLDLSVTHNKMLHVHTDQRNESRENGTERLVEAVKRFGKINTQSGEPMIWAVHAISPSTYEDERFYRLVNGLLDNNIGIICCPSAAIGMRQIRPILSPTYNSIPRVLEFLSAGIRVRLASDNIADICSPTTTADLTDEVFVLSAALRFYHIDILAKLATNTQLTEADMSFIREHLVNNDSEAQKVIKKYQA